MAKGYYLVIQDKTTCGGIITEGDTTHTLFGKAIAREQDRVTCGKHPGMYIIVGHVPGDSVMGRKFAGTLHSKSSCPCQARFIPSMMNDTYEFSPAVAKKTAPAQETPPVLSPYITGEKTPSGCVSDYPATALINTHTLPDDRIRAMLETRNQDVMLLTPEESYEILASWNAFKKGWVDITQSGPGQIVVNYGVNGRDAVNTSILIAKLGSFGIKATVYVNEKGTELIKLSGYSGIRKVLTAPVFGLKNPKVIDVGIGKYGLRNSIIEGGRLTFYFAAAYRTVDFILNDQATLSRYLGSLATDAVKIGISSGMSWVVGAGVATMTSFVVGPIIAVVVAGLITAVVLNKLDDKFGVTDKVISYIEAAQQEMMGKARELDHGIWDLGSMYMDKMLDKGIKIIESEVMTYLRDSIDDVVSRNY